MNNSFILNALIFESNVMVRYSGIATEFNRK